MPSSPQLTGVPLAAGDPTKARTGVSDPIRLRAVADAELTGHLADRGPDAVVATLKAACQVPMAVVNIVTVDTQTYGAEVGVGAAELAGGAVIALGPSEHGWPVLGTTDAPMLLVAVPADIETLRVTDPGLAKEWRTAVRDVLGGVMAGDARVTGYDRAGWYLVSRKGDSA